MKHLAVVALFFACTPTGPNNEMPGNMTAALTAESFCGELRKAQCAYRARCGLFETQEGCEAWELQWHGQPSCAPLVAAVKDDRQTFDAGKARTCLDTWKNDTVCLRGVEDRVTIAACDEAVAGKVAADGACYNSTECEATLYCDDSAMTCPGACKKRKAAGETAASEKECERGLIFNFDQKKCVARIAQDGACAAEWECQDGLTCLGMKCQPTLAEGGDCGLDSQCGGTLKCVNNKCAPSVKRNADRCYSSTNCTEDSTCALVGDTPQCIAKASEDGECFSDAACDVKLYCDSTASKCAKMKPAGQTCTKFGECEAGTYCKQMGGMPGTCTTLVGEGEPCEATGQGCKLGLICDTMAASPVCKPAFCLDED